MAYRITKEYRFEASHILADHPGKCSRLHGHSYRVEVAIEGPLKTEGGERGMVMDFMYLDTRVKPLVEGFDHRHLNDLLPDHYPTAEVLASCICRAVEETLPAEISWIGVRVWETATSSATYELTRRRDGEP